MSSLNSVICYLLVLIFATSQALAQSVMSGTAKIGEPCERDVNCIENAFCLSQRSCRCDPNYLPVPDNSLCVPSVGLFCNSDVTCSLMSNGECRQNVCACREGFTIDITNSSNCLARPTAENDPCQRNDECIETMDRALCINDRCQCLTNHHFSMAIGKCLRTAAIFQACENNYQCHMAEMEDQADAFVCMDGICKCTSDNKSRHCSGASSNSARMMIAFFFILVAVYLK